MKKYIILMLLLCSCTPDFEIPELPPLPTYVSNITPDVIPTLSPDAQVFQDTVDYYEKQVIGCLSVEAGEYLNPFNMGGAADLFLEDLRNDQTLFKNDDFVKVFTWMMDDISVYCTHHAVVEPDNVNYFPWVFQELNWDFEEADAEYYQYQRQGRIGIENGDMSLIESAFEHRENAHKAMQNAANFYTSLFEIY